MRNFYAELHCHSAFSFLDGASVPEELAYRAKEIGLSALALTDHDDLGGIVRFASAAKELSLEGIVGAELTLEDDSHLIVLAQDLQGYKNICHLITHARSNCSRGRPRVIYEKLYERSAGLIALTGCPHGRVPSALAIDNFDLAKNAALELKDVFQDRLYFELWNHHLHQESLIAAKLLSLSEQLSIPWVVTNNVHYSHLEKRIVHDVLTCLRHEVTLAAAGRRLRPNGSWYMKSPDEMVHLWRNYPEGIKNTLVVAERCQFRLGLLKPPLPNFEIPSQFANDVSSHNGLLEKLVWEGAASRYSNLSEKHVNQLNHELSMIMGLGLAPYFLIMWDIVTYARQNGIAVQGRGSAANSAVCYCLFITAVDPIGMELLFERFLSEGRNEPPDIDLDIAHQEREKVLQYVYEKYGRNHAAMVCEVITYRGRSAVRDAARVLGFSQEQADKLAAESHYYEALQAAEQLVAGGITSAGLDIHDARVQLLIKVVAGLHQLPRHRSIHVGGFVLSAEPIGDIVPVEPASMADRTVIQWDKDDLDMAGLIKIDLLGLGMLMMIQEGLKLVKKHRNIDIDLGQLNMNDPNIYDMLRAAETIGLFQVESRAQMSILPKLNPTCFYDIIVSIALVRPGPIQGNIIHPYLRRRRGDEPVVYLHPTLEPILKRTLGVPLFQEQGMKLAVVSAGFTPSQADNLRRVMSHKRSQEKMDALCVDLAIGMRANGFTEIAIQTITHQLRAFANYGFPESHAASFSLLVYASAFLKLYYGPEFYCAILNAQPMGFYSPATLIRDAMRRNIEVRPPDLAASSWDCTLEENHDESLSLRVGLRFVQGLGARAKAALEAAWMTGGSFKSLDDVIRRSGLSPADLKILARAGAFETLYPGRRKALWETLAKLNKKRETPLLDLLQPQPVASVIDEMSVLQEIVSDYNMMGLSTGQHPMYFYRQWAINRGIKSCEELKDELHNARISVAGCVICRQRPETAKGFVFLTLEDETGMSNVIIKPRVFDEYRRTILSSNYLSVTGKLQSEQGVINVIAEEVELLPRLPGDPHIPARNFH
ncbi:MAG TPA: error-prone DNA polymerase [Drouetiella sp.]